MTKNVANNVAQGKVQDYVKKSHNVEENEPKSEKTVQDVQKNCLSLTEQWKRGELIGQKFGKLTITRFDHKDKHYHKYYECKCDCGKNTVVNYDNLKRGLTKSCGCLISQTTSKLNKTRVIKDKHKYSDYSLYRTWIGMRKRCYSTTEPAYKDYGGRGITVCDEWNIDYNSFLKWAKNNGYQKGLTIDRINNDKGYYPENCRFVDNYVQANNKRNNIVLSLNGISDTLPNWARKLNVSTKLLYARYYKNNNPEYVFRGLI